MSRAYFSSDIESFMHSRDNEIIGAMTQEHHFSLEQTQRDAWVGQIKILKTQFKNFKGQVFFEYSIPRMGKRVDIVALISGVVFVIEFKVGESEIMAIDLDQATDYGLDLKNFHEESHDALVCPILVLTERDAPIFPKLSIYGDRLTNTLISCGDDLADVIETVISSSASLNILSEEWANSRYKPTPTIIEATLALYNNHSVEDITHRDSDDNDFEATTGSLKQIIASTRNSNQKSIVFVTGVPGAGKTLVGLDVATKFIDKETDLYSVFLSGNGPLVAILQEALARDKRDRVGCKIGIARSEAKAFIQNVHHFRDDGLNDLERPPIEHVAIFDEAQRAWDKAQTISFMKQKKGRDNFNQSEPQFLISCLDRHEDWAVVICLIGGGQEINTGEAGIAGWIDAIKEHFPHWVMYASDQLIDSEYGGQQTIDSIASFNKRKVFPELHLKSSMRSFRSQNVSLFVKQLLDIELDSAQLTLAEFKDKFPIMLTRDINTARKWLRGKARGSERFGMIASSQAERLRPQGVHIKTKVDPVKWFLEDKGHVRSSFYLEEVATEFDVQGLELDWSCLVWDADFRFSDGQWSHHSFRGRKWQNILKLSRQKFQKNAYRVLLTRARQGMVICVPEGDVNDQTRKNKYYDDTYNYLKKIGLECLDER